MEWLKIDLGNLPKNEVLAANFGERTFGFGEKLIGYLRNNNNLIICESKKVALVNCTHYIDIHKFDI